ncbi:MAG: hypothetical protein L0G94_07765 [Brachybacterium sp.]|uniref:hypothetical protein n=1 Tax=Brachybacterium sp. TaxID=1891286 RepID=UPI0026474D6D|nr:hypothetical protein [Brachybacterium sp.]MDN5686567.1 hypothetical protein [Brachybacterium sp.]
MITSIEDADDANAFSHEFDLGENQKLAMTADGIPFVYEQTGDEYHVVTAFSAPWTKNAEGNDPATAYSIEGDTVVQVVDVTDAAFPAIADPT